jgi:hypothetical protein
MELFSCEAGRRFAAALRSPPDRTRLLTNRRSTGQTARSTVAVDSFIDLAELLGC